LPKLDVKEIATSGFQPSVDIAEIIAVLKRQGKIVVYCGIIALILGTIYSFTATPRYTASATVFIDDDYKQIADEMSSDANRNAVYQGRGDDGAILSQVEILGSERIALMVADRLDLEKYTEFAPLEPSILSTALSAARSFAGIAEAEPEKPRDQKHDIIEQLARNLSANRVGRTSILEVKYISKSPELAALIANETVSAYLDDQYNSKSDATRRASEWLQTRIEALRKKSIESDFKVQKFRSEKGLISSGGELVSEQQLTQINTSLIQAQSVAAAAKSKFESAQAIVASGNPASASMASLDSPVINKLQQDVLKTTQEEAEIAKKFGSNHYQAVRLRSVLDGYNTSMFTELRRIADNYQYVYESALASVKTLQAQVAAATSTSAIANDDLVQLREYERTADTYKKLYETYLQRFQEASQRESFPITEARIISRADVPQTASYPKKPLFMALSLAIGCAAGLAIGAYREFGERFFRTGEQVQQELGMEFIGQVALSTKGAVRLPADKGLMGGRSAFSRYAIDRYIVDHPLSAFAETIRNAKIAADFISGSKAGRVIGVVSVLPREGKSTIAMNFAQYLAKQGARTLLIDADLRNPGATRAMGANARSGLYEVLGENEAVEKVLLRDEGTGLVFLPTVIKNRILFSAELLASNAMDELLKSFSKTFDYIIVDLPPVGPVIDAKAMSGLIDSFLLVVEWGQTSRRLVRTALQSHPTIRDKCAGVILNKVDLRKVKLYVHQDENFYHNARYGDYYVDNVAST
jgi:succinoglycan biosynthesis transport protein ExoP